MRVRGLRELQRGLLKADARVAKFLKGEFKASAGKVAEDARRRAPVRTGRLRAGIRPFATQKAVGVRSTAVADDGFEYPRRLEFEDRGSDPWGPRASLYPAAADAEETIEEDASRILNSLVDLDLGGGSPL